MADFDAVFIGSGHNALSAALILSHAGWRVLVLERAGKLGGALRTEELTLPGFRHDLAATNVGRFAVSPVYQQFRDDFEALGLRFLINAKAFASVYASSRAAVAYADNAAMEAALAKWSASDMRGWHSLRGLFDRIAPDLLGLHFAAMPSAGALRRAARIARSPGDAMRLARILMQSPQAFVAGFLPTPEVQSLILPWSFHSDFPPDVRGGAIFAFVTALSAQQRGIGVAQGGAGRITDALTALIARNGGECRVGMDVVRIHVRNGAAAAVETNDGQTISAARAIVASVTPRNLFGGLVVKEDLPAGFMRRIGRFRYGIGTFVVHMALSQALKWRETEELAEFNTVHINAEAEHLRRTYEQSEAQLIPERPLLIVSQTTLPDPSRAPAGRHIARIHSRAFPTDIRGDAAGRIAGRDWRAAREFVADRLVAQLAEHAPNVAEALLARRAVSPLDLEAENSNFIGGDCASGSQHLDQNYMFRPLLGWSRYRTPITNLYMTGSSTWPGSGIHGASGYLLAQELLKKSRVG